MPAPLLVFAPPLLAAAGRVLVQGATRAAARTAANRTAQGAATAGAAAGGGVLVNEEVQRRSDAAAQSRSTPVATTTSQTSTRQACKECPPDCGSLVTRQWNMSDISREYQARVTGFAPFTEWNFASLDFDGFKTSQCLLQEAKAKYDQFFDPEDGQPKFFFKISGEAKVLQQAAAQSAVVQANPPSSLHWYFMQELSYLHFSSRFRVSAPIIRTFLQP